FWSAQGLYTRAYYASGNTLTPMIASSLVTIASFPVYQILFKTYGAMGLTFASNIGIAANCLVMAWLVHRRSLARADPLNLKELTKATVTEIAAGILSYKIAAAFPASGGILAHIKVVTISGLTWAAASAAGLWLLRSTLLQDLRRR